MRPRIIDEGILHKNLNPGLRAEAAFLPNVVAISATEALCFYRIGTAFYSPDGQLAMLRSNDGGRTWMREGDVRDPKNDDYPWNYTAPHGARMRDGTLVVSAFRNDAADPENPDGPGRRPKQTILSARATEGAPGPGRSLLRCRRSTEEPTRRRRSSSSTTGVGSWRSRSGARTGRLTSRASPCSHVTRARHGETGSTTPAPPIR